MTDTESSLASRQRSVREAEGRLAQQTALIEHLQRTGAWNAADLAASVLDEMRATLGLAKVALTLEIVRLESG